MPEVHPTAIISPEAELADGVIIEPYVIIQAGVKIGRGTHVGAGTFICSGATIGEDNDIHMHVVIGDAPEHQHLKGEGSRVEIGDRNMIRAFVTIHRGAEAGSVTRIGSNNLLFSLSHVGHNCVLADGITLVNSALLGGHVEVSSHAYIGGGALVHQFVRIGTLAMIAGGARVTRDVPPFSMMTGRTRLVGLNRVGMRRAGIPRETRSEISRVYRRMFMSGARVEDVARELLAAEPIPEVREMVEFVLSSKRGLCAHKRKQGVSGLSSNDI